MVQTWVLKVSIHCEGCKKKVQRILQKVEGVQTIDIDSKQNRVTVTGDVDADSLIRRLHKYGKHSELLPDKNRTAPNSSSVAAASAPGNTNVKGEEKAAAAAAAAIETEQKQNDTQNKPVVEEETSLDATASEEVTAPKPDIDASLNRGGDMPTKSESDDESKEKGENVQREERRDESAGVYDPVSIAITPPERQPVYTMSYNTVHPSTSYAYYEAPPSLASSYVYSAYPPPSGYAPEYYSSESYYGSMEPPGPSAGSYDMFSEENPNACNLM